jgi:hypothetical protein
VFTDVSWRIWAWHHYAKDRAVLEHFKVEDLSTNDWSGIASLTPNQVSQYGPNLILITMVSRIWRVIIIKGKLFSILR